jgi:predicted DNA-binding WGR domain protein
MTNYKGDKVNQSFESVTLYKRSQGERGRYGNQKGYSIAVHDNRVYVRWGRAELSQVYWQQQVKTFPNHAQAVDFAWVKYYEKFDKGYTERVVETR